MLLYNGGYTPSYKNLPIKLLEKAMEIAKVLLEEGVPIATGLKRVRVYFTCRMLSFSD